MYHPLVHPGAFTLVEKTKSPPSKVVYAKDLVTVTDAVGVTIAALTSAPAITQTHAITAQGLLLIIARDFKFIMASIFRNELKESETNSAYSPPATGANPRASASTSNNWNSERFSL